MPPATRWPSTVHVLLVEVPAARAHLQRRDLVVELVALLAGRRLLLERERAPDRLADVDLALDLVGPERRVRVLEVGHVRVGARIEGVDDHLGVDRAGDLDPAPMQRRRHRRDLPVAGADRVRSRRGSRAARRRRSARARSARAASSSWRRGSKARCSLATSASAGSVRMVSKPGRIGALICTPAGRESVMGRSLGWEEGEDVVEAGADPGRLRAEVVERQAEAVDPERGVAEPGRADRVPAVARDEQDVSGGKAERLRCRARRSRDRS